jgi:hypothetical protein
MPESTSPIITPLPVSGLPSLSKYLFFKTVVTSYLSPCANDMFMAISRITTVIAVNIDFICIRTSNLAENLVIFNGKVTVKQLNGRPVEQLNS